MRKALLTAVLALSLAPGALAQEPPPEEPEPIPDFWTIEEETEPAPASPSAPPPDSGRAAPAPSGGPDQTGTPGPAPAPAPSPGDRTGGACGGPQTIDRALAVLRVAARDRLPGRPGAVVRLRVRPCFAGRLRLEVRHARTGALLAVARRTVGDRDIHTVRLVTTPAIRRYAGRRTPLRLRVTLRPRL